MRKMLLVMTVMSYIAISAHLLWAVQKADFGGGKRYAATGFTIGSKGYIGTGSDGSKNRKDFWEYDPVANTWTQKVNLGGDARYAAVGFSIGGKGYLAIGSNGSTHYDDVWEYDPIANTWTRKADFGGGARYGAVGFSIGEKGYIGTGSNGSKNLNDFWEYDPVADSWTQKADCSETSRLGAGGFSVAGKGYLGVGSDGTKALKDFWEYDPDTNTWTEKTDFGGTARSAVVGFSIGNNGYMGMGTNGTVNYSDIWEYNSATNVWTHRSDFEGTARYSVTGFPIGTKGYIGTGYDGSTAFKDFWEYDPTRDNVPDPFTFTDQSDVPWSRNITSNTITVSGINEPVAISITGGTYSINGGDYTDKNGTVSNGDNVTVKLASASSSHTTTSATVTIGGFSDTFSITTKYMIDVGESDPSCFIATAAFGSPMAGQVEILRQFRDRYLLNYDFGRKFVFWYYQNGPAAAKFIKDKPLVRAAVRTALYPVIGFCILLFSHYLPLFMALLLLSLFLFFQYKRKTFSNAR